MTFSDPTIDTVAKQLASGWLISTLIPVLIGGALSVLKTYIPNEKDLRQRISSLREALLEKCCNAEHQMLKKALQISLTSLDVTRLSELRGNGKDEPDVILAHISGIFSQAVSLRNLDSVAHQVRSLYGSILVTLIGGFACMLTGGLWEPGRLIVAVLAIVLIIVQVFCAVRLRVLENRLDNYDSRN